MRKVLHIKNKHERNVDFEIEKKVLIGVKTFNYSIALLFEDNEAMVFSYGEVPPEDSVSGHEEYYWECEGPRRLLHLDDIQHHGPLTHDIVRCKKLGIIVDDDEIFEKINKLEEAYRKKKAVECKQARYKHYLTLKKEFENEEVSEDTNG